MCTFGWHLRLICGKCFILLLLLWCAVKRHVCQFFIWIFLCSTIFNVCLLFTVHLTKSVNAKGHFVRFGQREFTKWGLNEWCTYLTEVLTKPYVYGAEIDGRTCCAPHTLSYSAPWQSIPEANKAVKCTYLFRSSEFVYHGHPLWHTLADVFRLWDNPPGFLFNTLLCTHTHTNTITNMHTHIRIHACTHTQTHIIDTSTEKVWQCHVSMYTQWRQSLSPMSPTCSTMHKL